MCERFSVCCTMGLLGWVKQRVYLYEVWTGLYMLDRSEKAVFSKSPAVCVLAPSHGFLADVVVLGGLALSVYYASTLISGAE